ncbi:hypothetical protein [Calothrix sp. PCC 6303]|uniref:hypothetical protein n=1 Tax=Calothrix sp. PCC 6303 TaxID=1170562 RepID=UPI0002A03E32|nr:hypothetical protein [Calothrix sp. PCC 6303]AFZ01731.1 hypothetical protein Cal6303_2761 [Calothrix sp. PCC 6303]
MRYVQRLYTQSSLAQEVSVSTTTIRNWCRFADITIPKRRSFFSCLDLELLAYFYVANQFLRVSQEDYLEEVVCRGGLKLYVREVRRTELSKFLTEFLTLEEQDYFFVKILIEKLKEEQSNESVNSSAAA